MRFLFIHAWGGFSLAEWYLRDALSTSAVEFESYDMPTDGVPINDTLPRMLVGYRPNVVGFSCHYWSIREFCEAAKWVKHLLPATPVVFGGPQVNSTDAAEQILRSQPSVDFVLRGAVQEGLALLLQAIAQAGRVEGIFGLSYRVPTGVSHNPLVPAPSRRNVPIFDRGNAALTTYLSHARDASYETVIGCRARCAYCVYPVSSFERIDDDLVEHELKYLCGFGIPNIRICDAHFAGIRSRAKRILRHLVSVNRGSSIKVYPDPRHVDDEYVQLLRAANADVTSIGIQSTNPLSLELIRRHAVNEHLEAVHRLLEAFPYTPADCIVGLPGDTPEGLERTFRDVVDFGFARINAFRLHLFPGTSLGDATDEFMSARDVACTATGQVLSSASFPVESLERVANLVHTVEVVSTLVQTRRWLRDRGRVSVLMDLADILDSATLFALHRRFKSPHPAYLLESFYDTVHTLTAGLGGEPPLLDLVMLDLVEFLRASCAERGVAGFQWGQDNRRITVVEIGLTDGRTAEWNLRNGVARVLREARHQGNVGGVLRLHSSQHTARPTRASSPRGLVPLENTVGLKRLPLMPNT